MLLATSGGTSLKPLVGFFFPTDLKTLVGNFLLVLKSNGIQIFLINDNNVIIRKLSIELSMT